jgi:hypothetical protein
MLFDGYAEEKVIYEGRHLAFILVIEMQSVLAIITQVIATLYFGNSYSLILLLEVWKRSKQWKVCILTI